MAAELEPDYYLRNFWLLLDAVYEQYADLLLKDELAFRKQFSKLSSDAQRLYVRLISRVGPLFRSDKLTYTEISDVSLAADELIRAGYLDSAEDVTIEDVVPLLTKAELAQALGQAQLAKLRRDELIDLVYTLESIELPFTILRPLQEEILTTYRLLFFGNLQQDLTDFVLSDLGLVTYEDYHIEKAARAFPRRQALDETLTLYALYELSQEALETKDHKALLACAAAISKKIRDPAIAQRRKCRLLNEIARQLERQGKLSESLSVYAQAIQPPARERTARVLHKLGRIDDAMDVIKEILQAPRDEAEFEFALAFRRKLQKQLSLTQDAPLPPVRLTAENSMELSVERGADCVEELARQKLEGRAMRCFYVENTLFNGLFGLAFWDIIFAAVAGVFFNRFQNAPADLYSSDFIGARSALIEARLKNLADAEFMRNCIRSFYHAKQGLANPFVDWRYLDEQLLELALERIPHEHLLGIFRRLLRDLRNNSSGFPDLICFPAKGGYELIEVKGPGDRLQANQKRWIRYFEEYQIPYRLALVSYA